MLAELNGLAYNGTPVRDFQTQKEIQTRMLCALVFFEIGAGLIETVTEGINSGAFNEARIMQKF